MNNSHLAIVIAVLFSVIAVLAAERMVESLVLSWRVRKIRKKALEDFKTRKKFKVVAFNPVGCGDPLCDGTCRIMLEPMLGVPIVCRGPDGQPLLGGWTHEERMEILKRPEEFIQS